MADRRSFMLAAAAGVAGSLLPAWGSERPAYLSCGRDADGRFVACGLSAGGAKLFATTLPARGHEVIFHPQLALAIAFSRRPGNFALALDVLSGAVLARLEAPAGRHFYGHGVFSADGSALYTTENDYANARGVIGRWATTPFARTGEFPSGGTGPHDVALLDDDRTLVVANGGLETHPHSGRQVLNPADFRSNLSYLATSGELLEQVVLPDELGSLSIRHLAVGRDGAVAFAMQDQDPATTLPLAGLHRRGGGARLLSTTAAAQRMLRGYAGSVSVDRGGQQLALTSPRGGVAHVFDLANGKLEAAVEHKDICGIAAASGDGFVASSGEGAIVHIGAGKEAIIARQRLQWDNHLSSV